MTVPHHVVGPTLTVEGLPGLRLDTDRYVDDLPGRVTIDTPDEPMETAVIGSDRDGWPVVADPDRVRHPVYRARYCLDHLSQ